MKRHQILILDQHNLTPPFDFAYFINLLEQFQIVFRLEVVKPAQKIKYDVIWRVDSSSSVVLGVECLEELSYPSMVKQCKFNLGEVEIMKLTCLELLNILSGDLRRIIVAKLVIEGLVDKFIFQ